MEKLVEKVKQILNQFATEELGNRLSQFAMLSLKSMILDSIKNCKPNDCKPIVKNAVDKSTEKKIIRK